MKYKIISLILACYGLIGLSIVIFTELASTFVYVIATLFYVIVPTYGAWGVWHQKRIALITSMLLFISQSIRLVDKHSIMPHISPITVSFPITDFSQGSGYLIDCFAIAMFFSLAWLLKEQTNKKH